MTVTISFEQGAPTFSPSESQLDLQFMYQAKNLIVNLVGFAKSGFLFAACDKVVLQNDIKKTHLQQINQYIQNSANIFHKQMSNYKFVSGLPLIIISELLNAINNFQPSIIAYVLTLIFPEQNLQMQDIVAVLNKNREYLQQYKNQFNQFNIQRFLEFSPIGQQSYSFKTSFDHKQVSTSISVKLINSTPQVQFAVSPELFVNALNLSETFLQDLVSLLKAMDYQIFDCYDGIAGQIWCQSISPTVMSYLMHYQAVTKAVINNRSNLSQENSAKPMVVGIDDGYDENTADLLSLALTQTSKATLQTIRANNIMTTFDIANIMYVISQSYRVFVFQYPEELAPQALWWLSQLTPRRFTEQSIRDRPEAHRGYTNIEKLLPESFILPVRGQVVFLSKVMNRQRDNVCQCACGNGLCINNIPAGMFDEGEVQTVRRSPAQNALLDQFIFNSYYVNVLCCQGGCRYYNDDETVQSTIRYSNRQNNVAIQGLQKMLVKQQLFYPGQIRAEIVIIDHMIGGNDSSIVPTQAANISGFFLITQPGVGLVDYTQADGIAICFNLNNCQSIATSLQCLYSLQSSDMIFSKQRVMFFGRQIDNFLANQQIPSDVIKEHSIYEMSSTQISIMLLSANPCAYFYIKDLLGYTTKQDFKDFLVSCISKNATTHRQYNNQFQHIAKRRNYITLGQLLVGIYIQRQLQAPASIQVQDQITFYASVLYKILLQQPVVKAINSVGGRILQHFIQLYNQYIYPAIYNLCSSGYENVGKLAALLEFFDQQSLFDTVFEDSQSASFGTDVQTNNKIKTELDTGRQVICQAHTYQQAPRDVPSFVLNANDGADCTINYKFVDFKNIKIRQGAFKSLAIKLVNEVLEEDPSKQNATHRHGVLAALHLDSLIPTQFIQFKPQHGQNILTSILQNQMSMSVGIMYQTYDIINRLLLKSIAQDVFQDQRPSGQLVYLYNVFDGTYAQIAKQDCGSYVVILRRFQQLFCEHFMVPVKLTDVYVYQHSSQNVYHGREFLSTKSGSLYDVQNDIYTAIPDVVGISTNLHRITNIREVQRLDPNDAFKQQYGNIFVEFLLGKYLDLFQQFKQRYLLFTFLNLEQTKQVVCKALPSKLYCSSTQAQRILTGKFIQYIQVSDQDVSLNYSRPTVLSAQPVKSQQLEDFTQIEVQNQLHDDSVFDEDYVRKVFLQYFNYNLGCTVALDSKTHIVAKFRRLLTELGRISLLLVDNVYKLLTIYTTYARIAILEQFSQRQQVVKDKLQPQILFSFYQLVLVAYRNILEERLPDYQPDIGEFSPVAGQIIKYFAKNTQQDIILQVAVESLFGNYDLLASNTYNTISCQLLVCLLSLLCNIDIVFERVQDLDFYSDILKIDFNKVLVKQPPRAEQIEDTVYYGDIVEKYKYLLPKSNYSLKYNLYVLQTNGKQESSELERIYRESYQNIIVFRGFDTKQLLRSNLPFLAGLNHDIGISQLKNLIIYCHDNVKLYEKEENQRLLADILNNLDQSIDDLCRLSTRSKHKISLQDKYSVLHIIFKQVQATLQSTTKNPQSECATQKFANLQVALRNRAVVQDISNTFILKLAVAIKQSLPNQNIQFIDLINEIIDTDDDVLSSIAIQQLQTQSNLDQFRIRHFIKPDNKSSYNCSTGKEEVLSCLREQCQMSQTCGVPTFSFGDIIKFLSLKVCWSPDIFQNNLATIFTGSSSNVIWVSGLLGAFDQQLVVNEIYNSLYNDEGQSWVLVGSAGAIPLGNQKICTYMEDYQGDYRCFQGYFEHVQNYTPQSLCLIVFSDKPVFRELVGQYIFKACFYQTSVSPTYPFKAANILLQKILSNWLDYDEQMWGKLQHTHQHLFTVKVSQATQGGAFVQQQNIQQQKFRIHTQQKLFQIFTQLQDQSVFQLNDLFNILRVKFTENFIEYFISFIQGIQASNNVKDWRHLYGGVQFILTSDITIVGQLLRQPNEEVIHISKVYLRNKNFNILRQNFQPVQHLAQLKYPVEGLNLKLHPFVNPYINMGSVLQQGQNQQHNPPGKDMMNIQVLQFAETSLIPQMLPSQHITINFIQVLLRVESGGDVRDAVAGLFTDPYDQQLFSVFLFTYFNLLRIYETEQITNFMYKNISDKRLESQKLLMFADLFVKFVIQVIARNQGITKEEVMENQQISVLTFCLQNSVLCANVAQMLHSLFRSDLQHYVTNFLMTAAQITDLRDLNDKITLQLPKFAIQCFEQNLSYVLFYIRFALNKIYAYNEQYYLILTFYYIIFEYNQAIQCENMANYNIQSYKDPQMANLFRGIKEKTDSGVPMSVILDIFDNEYVVGNQYVMNKLVQHYLCCSSFSQDVAVARREFCFLMHLNTLTDYNVVIQQFMLQHGGEEIFSMFTLFSEQYIGCLKVVNQLQFTQLLTWYQESVRQEFAKKDAPGGEQLIGELLDGLKNPGLKCPFMVDLDKFSKYGRLGKLGGGTAPAEQASESAVVRQFVAVQQNVAGQLLSDVFLAHGDVRFAKPHLSKQTEGVQFQFYECLKQQLGPQHAQNMVLSADGIAGVFPQVYQICRQNSVNEEQQSLPRWSLLHCTNCPQYYEPKGNIQYSNLTAISRAAQTAMLQEGGSLAALKRQIEEVGGRYVDNVKRVQFVQGFSHEDAALKPLLAATEAFVLNIGPDVCFHQLLIDNHDECIGLWMPGHVFESRLGIVHADCGLKDSRFSGRAPTAVQVRQLTPLATRLTWILTFCCILISLNTNPVTKETGKDLSILSDQELLQMPRDSYCVAVIQTCVSIVGQLRQCYLHETLVLYQQFLQHYDTLLRKQRQPCFAPKTAEIRDALEVMLLEASRMAEVSVLDVLKRNQQQVSVPLALVTAAVHGEQLLARPHLLRYLHMSHLPAILTAVVNATSYAATLAAALRRAVAAGAIQADQFLLERAGDLARRLAAAEQRISDFEQQLRAPADPGVKTEREVLSAPEKGEEAEEERVEEDAAAPNISDELQVAREAAQAVRRQNELVAEITACYSRFLPFYRQCAGLLTIGGGCQDNELPELADDPCVAQLIRMDVDQHSENLNDFAVLDELARAGAQFVQTLQLPHMFAAQSLGTIEVHQQSFILQ